MKKPLLHELTLALAAVSLFAACASAQTSPFNALSSGTFQAYAPPPGPVPVSINHPSVNISAPFVFSSLVATQLVDFTPTTQIPPGPPSVDGQCQFTAPDGSVLLGTYVGILAGTADPLVYLVPASFTFTGGTGPYAGATGGGLLTATVNFSDPAMISGLSTIDWQGSLTLIPEPHAAALALWLGLAGLALRRASRS
jgi:hypothetical protein